MKKKLEKYLNKVASNVDPSCSHPTVYYDGDYYYYTDGARVVRSNERATDKTIETYPVNWRRLFCFDGTDYEKFDLPTLNDVRAGIKNCSPNWKVAVRFEDCGPLLNAKYLKDSMYALNARMMYVDHSQGWRSPVFLFENDDLQTENVMCLLPINPGSYGSSWVGYKSIA